MKQHLMSIFFFVGLGVINQIHTVEGALHQIVKSKNFQDIFFYLSKNPAETLLAFDLDNTVMYPAGKGLVGGDHWFRYHLQKHLTQTNGDYEAALKGIVRDYIELQKYVRVQSSEPDAAGIIKTIQQKGVPVFALTARHAEQTADTRRQLSEIGIDFSHTNIPNLDEINKHPVPFSHHNGIVHCPCPPGNKGDALVKIVDYCGLNPKTIILVDDTLKHLQAAHTAIAKHCHSPSFIGIHYTRLEELRLDPHAALKELNHEFKARYWEHVRR